MLRLESPWCARSRRAALLAVIAMMSACQQRPVARDEIIGSGTRGGTSRFRAVIDHRGECSHRTEWDWTSANGEVTSWAGRTKRLAPGDALIKSTATVETPTRVKVRTGCSFAHGVLESGPRAFLGEDRFALQADGVVEFEPRNVPDPSTCAAASGGCEPWSVLVSLEVIAPSAP